MGKIKIHKSKLNMFTDGDIIVGYDDTNPGREDKWIFVYREDEDPEKIGTHVCYCESTEYLSIDCIYNKKYEKCIRQNKSHFNRGYIKKIRYANDEEINIIISHLNEKYGNNKKYDKIIKEYIDIIYESRF